MIIGLYIFFIITYGTVKKVNLYDSFINGVKDSFVGIKSIIAPIIAITIAFQVILNCGVIDILNDIISWKNVPSEIFIQALLKPISHNASLIIMNNIYDKYQINSNISFLSSIIQGSSDTTLYIVTLYFTSSKIKNSKYALKSALFNDFIAIILSFIVWIILFRK